MKLPPVLTSVLTCVALVAGSVVGVSSAAGCCGCPRVKPFPKGQYLIDSAESPDDPVVGALVTVGDETVEIDYTLPDDASWRVTYDIVGRYPD